MTNDTTLRMFQGVARARDQYIVAEGRADIPPVRVVCEVHKRADEPLSGNPLTCPHCRADAHDVAREMVDDLLEFFSDTFDTDDRRDCENRLAARIVGMMFRAEARRNRS